jgi:hypothetical protein
VISSAQIPAPPGPRWICGQGRAHSTKPRKYAEDAEALRSQRRIYLAGGFSRRSCGSFLRKSSLKSQFTGFFSLAFLLRSLTRGILCFLILIAIERI